MSPRPESRVVSKEIEASKSIFLSMRPNLAGKPPKRHVVDSPPLFSTIDDAESPICSLIISPLHGDLRKYFLWLDRIEKKRVDIA